MSFHVYQDFPVPSSIRSVESARLVYEREVAFDIDTNLGRLSVPGVLLGPGFGALEEFPAIEWGIGETSIVTHIRTLKLLRVGMKGLLVCSSSVALVEAVDNFIHQEVQNTSGGRAVTKGSLDCGTPTSDRMCIVGEPPKSWSGGERAVLVAANWTRPFSIDGTLLVCLPIGLSLPLVI